VRLDQLAAEDLSAEEKIAALALAIHDLGVAMGLVMIHGQEHGAQVYLDHGGSIRLDPDGNVLVPVPGNDPSEIRCRQCHAPAGEWCQAWPRYGGQPVRAQRLHKIRVNEYAAMQQPSVPIEGTADEGDPDGR
jgi:hypothetical protein